MARKSTLIRTAKEQRAMWTEQDRPYWQAWFAAATQTGSARAQMASMRAAQAALRTAPGTRLSCREGQIDRYRTPRGNYAGFDCAGRRWREYLGL